MCDNYSYFIIIIQKYVVILQTLLTPGVEVIMHSAGCNVINVLQIRFKTGIVSGINLRRHQLRHLSDKRSKASTNIQPNHSTFTLLLLFKVFLPEQRFDYRSFTCCRVLLHCGDVPFPYVDKNLSSYSAAVSVCIQTLYAKHLVFVFFC